MANVRRDVTSSADAANDAVMSVVDTYFDEVIIRTVDGGVSGAVASQVFSATYRDIRLQNHSPNTSANVKRLVFDAASVVMGGHFRG